MLLGSRGGESWLAPGTFGDNIYELPGLDDEAASALADKILTRARVSDEYRASAELPHVMRLLSGYPLALEVVLANLARQTPEQVLAALTSGDVQLDTGDPQDKTRSILRCIDYSHSNLSPEAQTLLACLVPFTSAVNTSWLPQYGAQLRAQPALAGLPFEQWDTVVQEAQSWGLLTPHPMAGGYLAIQPTLPYFLRSRLGAPAQAELRAAVEAAFRAHYDQVGGTLRQLAQAKAPDKRQLGLRLIGLEYENLSTALSLALAARVSILNTYLTLSIYLDSTQDQARGLALGETVLAQLEQYPAGALSGMLGAEFASVLDDIAKRQLLLKRYKDADRSYQKALELLLNNTGIDANLRKKLSASIHHQLGRVAQAQRQWARAEQHYQQALAVFVEFGDRYTQASTYHQLGRVAEAQRQWAQAEQHYQQALAVFVEFNDRYHQASTYNQLGMVAEAQRQWAQAEQHYQQALAIWVEFDDRYGQAKTYHQLGMVAEAQRQWVQAEQHYQQALAIKVEFNDRYEQAGTYHQLGIVAQAQQQWAQAEQHYQQALAIWVAFDDRYHQASTYHQLGSVAQAQRQWGQAGQHYQQALAVWVAFDDRYHQASTYHQLGMVAEEQRQWAQAGQHYQQALAVFVEFNDSYTATICLRSLARLWQASGDATLPAAVAAVVGGTAAEAEKLMRALLAGEGA